jgi:hypothetical protein
MKKIFCFITLLSFAISGFMLIMSPAFAEDRERPVAGRYSVMPRVGTDFTVGGSFVDSASTSETITIGSNSITASLDINSQDFNDVYHTPITAGLNVNYGITDSTELLFGINYLTASAKEFTAATFSASGDFAGTAVTASETINAKFDDYHELGFSIGARHFYNRYGAFAPYFSLEGGLNHTDDIEVEYSVSDTSITNVSFYEDSWTPNLRLGVGFLYNIKDSISIGLETGLNYNFEINDDDTDWAGTADLEDSNNAGERWSIPLMFTVRRASIKAMPTRPLKAVVDEDNDSFYIIGGSSAVFFSPPDRDEYPIVDGAGTVLSSSNLLNFDNDDIAVVGNIGFGYRFASSIVSRSKLLGENLRFETLASYFESKDRHDSHISGNAITGFDLENNDLRQVLDTGAFVDYESDYDFIDVNFRLKTDYTIFDDRLFVSPYVGGMYARFEQDFSTRLTNDSDSTDYYLLKEELKTNYWGATVGAELKVNVFGRLHAFLDGMTSFMFAHTDLDVNQNADGTVTFASTASDREDKFAIRTTESVGVSYDFNWLTVKLKGGIDYWTQVATVGYNMPALGEATGFGPFPPNIDQDDMTNWNCGVEFEFHFPKTRQ